MVVRMRMPVVVEAAGFLPNVTYLAGGHVAHVPPRSRSDRIFSNDNDQKVVELDNAVLVFLLVGGECKSPAIVEGVKRIHYDPATS